MSLTEESTVLADRIRPALRRGAPRLIAELASLVRIPSVSWTGFDQGHLESSVERVQELLRDTQLFDHVGVYRHGEGAPAVVARREPQAGAPTVVLYAHHDVQPPGDSDQWDSDPYQPTVRNSRLYGRGSADDKAGIAVHLAALRTLMEPDAEPLSLGIVVFIEGEEENGSPSFAGFLNEFQELLHGTIIVVADSDNPAPDLPAITTSLRGNVTAVLRIRTLDHALHSGMFGGAVPDALMAFARLASSVYDDHGGVAVAGLTSTVAGGFGPVGLAPPEAGLLPGVTEIGHGSLKDRLWQNAAITVTGLDVPSVPEASNTLVPEVRAKISLRVPPGMSASQALEALTSHLELHIPWGALWSLEDVTTGESFVVEESRRAVVLAGHALEAGFGNPVVHQGVGGSIPFISQLSQQFPDAHIVVTGVEDPDTRAHSPNESLNLGVLWRQALSESIFLALVNRRGHSDFVGETGVE